MKLLALCLVCAAVPVAPYAFAEEHQPGVIGADDRRKFDSYVPDPDFGDWRAAADSVVHILCGGAIAGGGVLIAPDRILTAGHVVLHDDGTPIAARATCDVHHPSGDIVRLVPDTASGGGYAWPDGRPPYLLFDLVFGDWTTIGLDRPPEGARPLRLATRDTFQPRDLHPVLNVSGPQGAIAGAEFLAQTCRYHGPPAVTFEIDEAGAPSARWRMSDDIYLLGRFDCDSERGASGTPIIGWEDGVPVLWGILNTSIRGNGPCLDVNLQSCYSLGPMVMGMELGE